jgi:hypothetical protein
MAGTSPAMTRRGGSTSSEPALILLSQTNPSYGLIAKSRLAGLLRVGRIDCLGAGGRVGKNRLDLRDTGLHQRETGIADPERALCGDENPLVLLNATLAR